MWRTLQEWWRRGGGGASAHRRSADGAHDDARGGHHEGPSARQAHESDEHVRRSPARPPPPHRRAAPHTRYRSYDTHTHPNASSHRSAAGRRKKRDKKQPSATSAADEAELEDAREAAEAAAVRPALAPQVQFDPDTGRIIIDDSTLTHVRQNPSNRAAGTLGRAVAEGESTVTSASCECLLCCADIE